MWLRSRSKYSLDLHLNVPICTHTYTTFSGVTLTSGQSEAYKVAESNSYWKYCVLQITYALQWSHTKCPQIRWSAAQYNYVGFKSLVLESRKAGTSGNHLWKRQNQLVSSSTQRVNGSDASLIPWLRTRISKIDFEEKFDEIFNF